MISKYFFRLFETSCGGKASNILSFLSSLFHFFLVLFLSLSQLSRPYTWFGILSTELEAVTQMSTERIYYLPNAQWSKSNAQRIERHHQREHGFFFFFPFSYIFRVGDNFIFPEHLTKMYFLLFFYIFFLETSIRIKKEREWSLLCNGTHPYGTLFLALEIFGENNLL